MNKVFSLINAHDLIIIFKVLKKDLFIKVKNNKDFFVTMLNIILPELEVHINSKLV